LLFIVVFTEIYVIKQQESVTNSAVCISWVFVKKTSITLTKCFLLCRSTTNRKQ